MELCVCVCVYSHDAKCISYYGSFPLYNIQGDSHRKINVINKVGHFLEYLGPSNPLIESYVYQESVVYVSKYVYASCAYAVIM